MKLFGRSMVEKRNVYTLEDQEFLKLLGMDTSQSAGALNIACYYTCLRILSDTIGKLPVKLIKSGKNNSEKVDDHYLYNLIKLKPNPIMVSTVFFAVVENQRNHYGNAVIWIQTDSKGFVKALYPLDFKYVQVYIDDKGIIGNEKGGLWYLYDDGKKKLKLKSTEVLHLRSGVSFDGVLGLSVRGQLAKSIQNIGYGDDYVNSIWEKGMFNSAVVQHTGDIGDSKALARMTDQFNQYISGIKSAGKVIPVPPDYKFTPINQNLADVQFLEINNLKIREITAAFGVPMHMLNDLSRATHSNIEQQQKEFYVNTLMSIIKQYEEELTVKLLRSDEVDRGMKFQFNLDVLLRASLKERYEAYGIGIDKGFLKPSEARKSEDLSYEEAGDVLLVNGTYVRLEEAGLHSENYVPSDDNTDKITDTSLEGGENIDSGKAEGDSKTTE